MNNYENNYEIYETQYGQNTVEHEYQNTSDSIPALVRARKKRGAGKIVALALCCSLLGGTVGATGAVFATSKLGGDNGVSVSSTVLEGEHRTPLNVAHVNTDSQLTASEIYAQNVNSTVGITTEITTNYFGFQTTSAASGSGFILTADGYIVTNYHVIEGAKTVKVTMYDGTAYDAVIIGGDESNDIAVLKIEADGLTPVVLGSSDELSVGDDVVAIGNPLGELTFSLTKGAVSALDREVTLSGGNSMNLIQTDCAINSGNSGGALFNMYGEVIGITNAKYSSNGLGEASIDNIGFAIPIDSVRSIITSIIEKGYVAKPYIGVTIENVSEDMTAFGLPQGAVIRSVTEGSPAKSAGLEVNDIVTAVGGSEISGSADLKAVVSESQVGDELKLTVYRQGKTLDVTVTVAEQPKTAAEQPAEQPQQSFDYYFPWSRFF